MKQAQVKTEIIADIHSLSHDGRGITIVDGKTTFVSGAINGEKVKCILTKKHSRYNEASVTEVILPSPERTQAQCDHFSICGGCSLQHLSLPAQIQLKQKTLLEQLQHFGKVIPEKILPSIIGKTWGYRRKARLGVRYVRKKDRVLVGFREKFSNFLADINSCVVLDPKVGNKIPALSELIRSLSQYEHIPQIEIAASDAETALIFRHLNPLSAEDINKLCVFGETNNFSIFLQPGSPASVHKIWPQNQHTLISYHLSQYQLEMHFHPLDFIQVNGDVNHLMLAQALELLDIQATDKILDLFCGLGNFTLPIAKTAAMVTGIEGSEEMVVRAQQNAALNNITNVEFFAANLFEPPVHAEWMKKAYDKVLLDPPRAGAQEILEYFSQLKPKKIVYVSCNPATLARDAGYLVYTLGYKLKATGVINMFSHTSHTEAIALFEK